MCSGRYTKSFTWGLILSFHQSFAAGVITIASLQLATVPVERQFQRQYILSKTSGTAFQQSIACSPTSVKQLFALLASVTQPSHILCPHRK